jgi:hypothetical protein
MSARTLSGRRRGFKRPRDTISGVRWAIVGLVALVPLLTVASGAGARHVSGLRGVVMEGPTTPVCRFDDPCERPAKGLLLQFTRGGKVVAEAKTTQKGKYSVALKRGRYGVKAPKRRIGAGVTPKVVRVPQGRIAKVDFHVDTGIQ